MASLLYFIPHFCVKLDPSFLTHEAWNLGEFDLSLSSTPTATVERSNLLP